MLSCAAGWLLFPKRSSGTAESKLLMLNMLNIYNHTTRSCSVVQRNWVQTLAFFVYVKDMLTFTRLQSWIVNFGFENQNRVVAGKWNWFVCGVVCWLNHCLPPTLNDQNSYIHLHLSLAVWSPHVFCFWKIVACVPGIRRKIVLWDHITDTKQRWEAHISHAQTRLKGHVWR